MMNRHRKIALYSQRGRVIVPEAANYTAGLRLMALERLS